VGIYSGEMSERKVGYRFDTLASHISNSALTRGREHVKNDYREYISTLGDKYKGCLKVLTPSMISGPAGVNSLRAFIEKENLDILCVDQHSLLEDDRNARNPVERAANISKDLKNLQVMKKIPIIAVSQQNRASTETGVGTANIAQSDRISQDSTVILFLEQKDNILTMTLAKARDATNNKKLHYAADFDKGVFQYMPSEDDNPSSCEELREEYDGVNVDGDDVF
jgi:replicative DNA helicase